MRVPVQILRVALERGYVVEDAGGQLDYDRGWGSKIDPIGSMARGSKISHLQVVQHGRRFKAFRVPETQSEVGANGCSISTYHALPLAPPAILQLAWTEIPLIDQTGYRL
jgi:hypothetical protein